jgi:hypothetical protein
MEIYHNIFLWVCVVFWYVTTYRLADVSQGNSLEYLENERGLLLLNMNNVLPHYTVSSDKAVISSHRCESFKIYIIHSCTNFSVAFVNLQIYQFRVSGLPPFLPPSPLAWTQLKGSEAGSVFVNFFCLPEALVFVTSRRHNLRRPPASRAHSSPRRRSKPRIPPRTSCCTNADA